MGAHEGGSVYPRVDQAFAFFGGEGLGRLGRTPRPIEEVESVLQTGCFPFACSGVRRPPTGQSFDRFSSDRSPDVGDVLKTWAERTGSHWITLGHNTEVKQHWPTQMPQNKTVGKAWFLKTTDIGDPRPLHMKNRSLQYEGSVRL